MLSPPRNKKAVQKQYIYTPSALFWGQQQCNLAILIPQNCHSEESSSEVGLYCRFLVELASINTEIEFVSNVISNYISIYFVTSNFRQTLFKCKPSINKWNLSEFPLYFLKLQRRNSHLYLHENIETLHEILIVYLTQ